ncbi:MAG: hypothetical protein H6575_16215 [Lewinellaceae bacterium]|nr:hypothetical protein [Lewinellaceae bacterium]
MRISRLTAPFLALFLLYSFQGWCCGYSFVGDCSSSIFLSINGTVDSFVVAPCPGLLAFDGFSIGNIQSLSITRAKAVTWESCQNNVSGMALYYRVYEQGQQGGAWSHFDLQEDYNTLVGPYTTRYRSGEAMSDLTSGLATGKTYVLEIYFQAEVDTVGDDFIPEITILQDNNGQNYHFTFQYGGASAPPFAIAATREVDVRCQGDSTGVAGVTVYGDASGLFYQWSTGGNNFPILGNIPAGDYSVTVSDGTFTDSLDFSIDEPDPLTISFPSVTGPGCGGTAGVVSSAVSGGTLPYFYLWDDGQQADTAYFSLPGSYLLVVTDANQCTVTATATIPAAPVEVLNLATEACRADGFSIGGQQFFDSGTYDFDISGTGGDCDTLVHLALTIIDPETVLAVLPDSALITCVQPQLALCALAQPNAQYAWKKNGVLLANLPCVTAGVQGNYIITVSVAGDDILCSLSHSTWVEAHLTGETYTTGGTIEYIAECYDPDTLLIQIYANTDAVDPVYIWTYDGAPVSSTGFCTLVLTDFNFPSTGLPEVQIIDAYGCEAIHEGDSIVWIMPPQPPVYMYSMYTNFCTGLVSGSVIISGDQGPYVIQLADSIAIADTVSYEMLPGNYPLVVTDANGCTNEWSLLLESPVTIYQDYDPWCSGVVLNAVTPTGSTPGNYQILWSNGMNTSAICDVTGGTYCVTATDISTGCAVDTCLSIPVSITDLPGNSTLLIAPNPALAGQRVDMLVPGRLIGPDVKVELFDLQGKSYGKMDVMENSGIMHVQMPEQLIPGIFMICIRENNRPTLMGKVLIR